MSAAAQRAGSLRVREASIEKCRWANNGSQYVPIIVGTLEPTQPQHHTIHKPSETRASKGIHSSKMVS